MLIPKINVVTIKTYTKTYGVVSNWLALTKLNHIKSIINGWQCTRYIAKTCEAILFTTLLCRTGISTNNTNINMALNN